MTMDKLSPTLLRLFRRRVPFVLLISDVMLLLAVYWLVRLPFMTSTLHFFKLGQHGQPKGVWFSVDWYMVLVVGVALYLGLHGHYSQRKNFWEELRDLARAYTTAAVVDLLLLLYANVPFQAGLYSLHWGCLLVLAPTCRLLTVYGLDRIALWRMPAVIIGNGENAYQTWLALSENAHIGCQAQLILIPADRPTFPPLAEALERHGIPVAELSDDLDAQLHPLGISTVIIALEEDYAQAMQPLINALLRLSYGVNVVPSMRGVPLYGLDMQYVFGSEVMMLRVSNNLARLWSRVLKRAIDMVLSVVLIVVFSPVFAWIAWNILRQSGAPLLFGHTRIGRNGQPFNCLKFRTMIPDAQQVLQELLDTDPEARAEWERTFKLRDDPRITPIGTFLRKTSLDELPQLFNVLRGEMSLVGPRPIIAEEMERYGADIQYYLETRPGITGIWQISGRSDIGYDRRVFLDTWYVKNWSLWYDLMILIMTSKVVFRRSGAY